RDRCERRCEEARRFDAKTETRQKPGRHDEAPVRFEAPELFFLFWRRRRLGHDDDGSGRRLFLVGRLWFGFRAASERGVRIDHHGERKRERGGERIAFLRAALEIALAEQLSV